MNTIAPQLPTILGCISAMLVAFLSLINGTPPATCLMKATAAFLVFAGFGLILRIALTESQQSAAEREESVEHTNIGLDMIVPGTSVADLLGAHHDMDSDALHSGAEAA